MDRRRYHYIERDEVFKIVKKSTEFLTDDQINKILDEHNWSDLTFYFDIREHGIKTIIIDNKTKCDVALSDLNSNAKHFYHKKMRELSKKDVLGYIKQLLGTKKAV